MLPRVSAALAQFIAPIATSGKQTLSSQRGFERFAAPLAEKRDRDKNRDKTQGDSSGAEQRPPDGKVLPFVRKDATPATAVETSPTGPPTLSGPMPTGISQALMQLMNLLSDQRATVLRWLGAGAYQNAARHQKKNGRARKGTILDERAE